MPDGMTRRLDLQPPDKDWGEKEVTASGKGAPPEEAKNIAQRRLMGLSAARREALRNLARKVMQAPVNEHYIVWNYATHSSETAAEVQNIINTNARLVEEKDLGDNTWEITLALDIKVLEELVLRVRTERAKQARIELENRKDDWQSSARKNAVLNAYDNLLVLMQGLQVDHGITIEDLMVTNKGVKDQVIGIIRGAKTVDVQYQPDGTARAAIEFNVSEIRKSVKY
jgi:hypothetical protein